MINENNLFVFALLVDLIKIIYTIKKRINKNMFNFTLKQTRKIVEFRVSLIRLHF